MANLLLRDNEELSFPALSTVERKRCEQRLRRVVQLELARTDAAGRSDALLVHAHAHEQLEIALDELESAPTQAGLESLLEELAQRREAEAPAVPDPAPAASKAMEPPGGAFICYWPGRSLGTGEAEIASLGFFDVLDRPPLGLWLVALSRPRTGGSGSFDVAVLTWVPAGVRARAEAGQSVCASGALEWLEQASPQLEAQLRSLLQAAPGSHTG